MSPKENINYTYIHMIHTNSIHISYHHHGLKVKKQKNIKITINTTNKSLIICPFTIKYHRILDPYIGWKTLLRKRIYSLLGFPRITKKNITLTNNSVNVEFIF